MNATSKAARSASAVTLPSVAQTITLLIEQMESRLERQIETRLADEHWKDDDVFCDLACELALERVRQMKAGQLHEYNEFSGPWARASSALELSKVAFSRKECAYYRGVEAICGLFDQGAAIVEYAHMSQRANKAKEL